MKAPTENDRRRRCPRTSDPLPCAVPGWATLASRHAELKEAAADARNQRRGRTSRKGSGKGGGGTYIDLGLALLSCLLLPGERLTSADIAAWCGCSRSAIQDIERRALAKMRERLVDEMGEADAAREIASLLAALSAPG